MVVAALAFAIGGCAPGMEAPPDDEDADDAATALANDDPSKILVYTSNLENLAKAEVAAGDPASCRGDWQDLLFFMAASQHAPDVILLQQITDKAELEDKVIAKLHALLGEEYGAIIAEAAPAYWGAADCSAKHYQTNAILYRKSRFGYVDGTKKTWRSRAADAGGSCAVTSASRYVNVAAKLADRLRPFKGGFAELAVGSVHWPVVDGCGVTNANEADAVMASYSGAQLRVFGGDMNLPELVEPKVAGSGYRPWYRHTNGALGEPGNLGWVDPVYAGCVGSGDVDGCLIGNATMRFGSRYDFLFAKYKPAYADKLVVSSEPHTVSFAEAGDADRALTGSDNGELSYSMHRAVRAFIHW